MALSLLTSAQTCVSSDKYLTIRVCDGCFVEVPVSELADTYRYVGELLTDVLQLAAGEGGRGRWGVNGPDPERAKDYSILLNGEKPPELITANTEIESRLLDRIRRFAGWPADLVPSEGKSSRAKAGPVAAPQGGAVFAGARAGCPARSGPLLQGRRRRQAQPAPPPPAPPPAPLALALRAIR